MLTVCYFGYAVRADELRARASAFDIALSDWGDEYEVVLEIIWRAGLRHKADVHTFARNGVKWVYIVLASTKWDPYAPRMPVGKRPLPETYKSVRESLHTEKLGTWTKFTI